MTAVARDLLAAFDTLDPTEKQQVAVEILRHSAGIDDLADETFDKRAVELFQGYEVDEAAGADPLTAAKSG